MANWWTLKILSGTDAGKSFQLKPERTLIGRVKGHVTLDRDHEASSVHAEIVYDAGRGSLTIQDLKSRNGTRVNGEKVEKRVIQAGDKIKVGLTEMVLEPPTTEETVVASALASHLSPIAVPGAASKMPEPIEKKTPSPRPSSLDKPESLPQPRDFSGFFKKFFGVILSPNAFFDYIGDDLSLKPAFAFGAVNWLLGGLISGVLSYYFMFVWNLTPPSADFGHSPVAIAIATLVGFVLIPVVAAVFHLICHALGGRAPFARAFQIACYLSAIHFIRVIAVVFPKAGPFLGIAGAAYTIYAWTVAAVRLYHVPMIRAYASCGTVILLSVTTQLLWQSNAKKMAFDLAGTTAPRRAAPAAQPAEGTPIVTTNASEPPVAAVQPLPESPVSPVEQRDPAAASPPAPNAPAPAAGGDPEPPQFN